MTDAELKRELKAVNYLYDEWSIEAERLRLGRLECLDEAYHQCNRWHARLNFLLGLQKARKDEQRTMA